MFSFCLSKSTFDTAPDGISSVGSFALLLSLITVRHCLVGSGYLLLFVLSVIPPASFLSCFHCSLLCLLSETAAFHWLLSTFPVTASAPCPFTPGFNSGSPVASPGCCTFLGRSPDPCQHHRTPSLH